MAEEGGEFRESSGWWSLLFHSSSTFALQEYLVARIFPTHFSECV